MKFQPSNNILESTKTFALHSLPFSSRQFLNQRHRLSHQQIDGLLNEQYSNQHIDEKYGQLFQVSEFIKLSDEFRKASIPFIPLKGPILSYRLHNDPSYRYSNDLDFLVSANTIENAILILKNNGYEPHYFSWPNNAKKKRRLIKLSNQILFVNPKNQINIEIHWKLFSYEFTDSGVLSEVLKSNKSQIQFKKRNIQIFSNELELLYLIIHGGLHSWFRLKWLVDVKDFIEKIPFDAEKFIQLTEKLSASRMVSLCNAVLSEYFPECQLLPCKTSPDTTNRLKYTISSIEEEYMYYEKLFLERTKFYSFLIKCFPGFRYKLSVIGVIFYSKYLSIFGFQKT